MIPFQSALLAGVMSTPAMQEIWSERSLLAKWLEVERAITQAQCELGMVPAEAAATILERLTLDHIPVERVHSRAQRSGHLMVGFLREFRDICGEAAEHFHLGPTTQDVLDTGLVLQMVEAEDALGSSLQALETMLCTRAREYRDTPMIGRTHEQHALPYTFGFELASWAWELRRHMERAQQATVRWKVGSLSGGVGTQNSFVELSDAETARRLESRMCELVGLPAPLADIHSQFHRFTEVVSNLAMLSSSLGRMGLHLRTLERPEIAEIEQVYSEESCNSSTMPNKRNPEAVERVEGLAQLVSGHAVAMMNVRMADHRDGTRIPTLYTAIPQSYAMTHKAVETLLSAVSTLRARPERMLANLNHPEALCLVPSERIMLALYRRTGRKHWAHSLLSDCTNECRATPRSLGEVLRENREIGQYLSSEELDELLDLGDYLGTSSAQVDRILHELEQSRPGQPPSGGETNRQNG